MKAFDEIKKNRRIVVLEDGIDGFTGLIAMPTWKGSLVVSKGGGWEHISVSPAKLRIIPTWEDMRILKDIFWNEDEAVIEVHPPKAEYVNNMPNCMHLWRCYYKDMVLPPSCFVGIKKGQTNAELMAEIKEAYELAGETI